MRKLYKNLIISLSVLALISILFNSCKKDEKTVCVIKAINESSSPVVGAMVHAAKGSIDTLGTTDSKGEWSLELKLPAILDATVTTAISTNTKVRLDSTYDERTNPLTNEVIGHIITSYTLIDVEIIDSLKGTGGLRFEENKTVNEVIVLRKSYSDTIWGLVETVPQYIPVTY